MYLLLCMHATLAGGVLIVVLRTVIICRQHQSSCVSYCFLLRDVARPPPRTRKLLAIDDEVGSGRGLGASSLAAAITAALHCICRLGRIAVLALMQLTRACMRSTLLLVVGA